MFDFFTLSVTFDEPFCKRFWETLKNPQTFHALWGKKYFLEQS